MLTINKNDIHVAFRINAKTKSGTNIRTITVRLVAVFLIRRIGNGLNINRVYSIVDSSTLFLCVQTITVLLGLFFRVAISGNPVVISLDSPQGYTVNFVGYGRVFHNVFSRQINV